MICTIWYNISKFPCKTALLNAVKIKISCTLSVYGKANCWNVCLGIIIATYVKLVSLSMV